MLVGFDVGLVGDFDSYILSDDVSAWLTVIPQVES